MYGYEAFSNMTCRAASEKHEALKARMEYPDDALGLGSSQLISRAIINPEETGG
jgi:hypothetical protein